MSIGQSVTLWRQWAKEYILADIQADWDLSHVPVFSDRGWEYGTMSESLKNCTESLSDDDTYLYIFYVADQLTDGPWTADAIRPVYVGMTEDPKTRFNRHIHKFATRNSDGSDDEWKKYHHLAAILENVDGRLFAWARPNSEIDTGPYGYSCYPKELEAKLVGLLHRIPVIRRTLINREYVPNWSRYERYKERSEWVDSKPLSEAYEKYNGEYRISAPDGSKQTLWSDWVNRYPLSDINDETTVDPVPLFETTSDDRTVHITPDGTLERTSKIETHIEVVGSQYIQKRDRKPIGRDLEGLLYIMYQLDNQSKPFGASDFMPLYIGKAEVWGTINELSNNFKEIAGKGSATRTFARWGDGEDWHIGKLSAAVRTGDEGYIHWADMLFEPGSRKLRKPTYLWVHPWNRSEDTGPYGMAQSLAALEPQLIALAYESSPTKLLNKDNVPTDAPINQTEAQFEPPNQWPDRGTKQHALGDFF